MGEVEQEAWLAGAVGVLWEWVQRGRWVQLRQGLQEAQGREARPTHR